MLKLKVRGKKGEAVFSGVYLNTNREIEFRRNNLKSLRNKVAVFRGNKLFIQELNLYIDLSQENINKINQIGMFLVNQCSALYRDLLSGEEPLFLLESGLKDNPYFVTSPTILDARVYSEKHKEALIFSFSDKALESMGIDLKLGYSSSDDIQLGVNYAAKKLDLKPNYIHEGIKVIKLTLRDIVSALSDELVA